MESSFFIWAGCHFASEIALGTFVHEPATKTSRQFSDEHRAQKWYLCSNLDKVGSPWHVYGRETKATKALNAIISHRIYQHACSPSLSADRRDCFPQNRMSLCLGIVRARKYTYVRVFSSSQIRSFKYEESRGFSAPPSDEPSFRPPSSVPRSRIPLTVFVSEGIRASQNSY